jgi:hypothetical protein
VTPRATPLKTVIAGPRRYREKSGATSFGRARSQPLHAGRERFRIITGVIELRLEGHSTADAARLLNEDPDRLRVRLNRLRQQVRESGMFDDWL